MSLEEVPMRVGGGAKRSVSLERGVQVSMATQRVATTTRLCHTEKLSGDTYQPLYSPRPAKMGGGGGGSGKLLHKGTICSSNELHDFEREYASLEAWRNLHAK